MLKGISPLISPELLAVLARMGHGDEIVLADAHFPGESFNGRVLRADGLRIPDLLAAILPLFELDVEKAYMESIRITNPDVAPIDRINRFAFYERTKLAFAVVITGETAKYGNIILKKGVTP